MSGHQGQDHLLFFAFLLLDLFRGLYVGVR